MKALAICFHDPAAVRVPSPAGKSSLEYHSLVTKTHQTKSVLPSANQPKDLKDDEGKGESKKQTKQQNSNQESIVRRKLYFELHLPYEPKLAEVSIAHPET